LSTPQALQNFADWVATIRGEEASEAQTYVNRLLQAWGWADSVEAGVIFERKIPGGSIGGGLGKADALIEGLVLIEMKTRGQLLQPAFAQLDRYNQRLIPKPSYCILCNFDEIWIYDFLSERGDALEPVDKLHVSELPRRHLPLAFLSKERQTPQFGVNRFEVTEAQARRMGELFCLLKARGEQSGDFNALDAQRFVLQCVLTMFAEDRGMLPDGLFNRVLQDCRINPQESYDLIAGLFEAMNTQGLTSGGRFKGTPYFNGGLFSHIPRIELEKAEVEILAESALDDWSQVQPSIFGNIFEASSDPKTRHARGQHFTSEQDILKVIRPTIIDPWEKRIFKATITGGKEGSTEKLEALQQELVQFIVCDPACGSGNFLYMAYNAVKNLEALILQRINDRRKSENKKAQTSLSLVTPLQFFGMDISPFAVELARVTLMIARKVANDRLGLTERDLPLDNLDNNIRVADALFTPWPEADAYVGNPPFLGGKRLREGLGDDYVKRLYERFPDSSNFADICCYWFRLAHDNLSPAGRAGLVGTNMIRRGYNRKASLDYIGGNGGYIDTAISTQPWSGEANVHVSIVNWSKRVPVSCRLDGKEVAKIHAFLGSTVDVGTAEKLKVNSGFSFIGAQPTGKGFEIPPLLAAQWIQAEPKNAVVLKPLTTADNLTSNPLGQTNRWIIDFNDMPIEEADSYFLPFSHAKSYVQPERLASKNKDLHVTWWRHWRSRPAMKKALQEAGGGFVFPCHSKWVIPLMLDPASLANNSTTVVVGTDYYLFALITSGAHRIWINAQKSTLKGDTRYTPTTCFETFPFPQIVAPELVQKIREAMTTLNDYRNEVMVAKNCGITDLYNAYFHEPASQLAKLHQGLDALVLKAYGWKASEDILSNLLDLNLELAEREAAGEKVVGPWAPA
jgi:hypothetical protein